MGSSRATAGGAGQVIFARVIDEGVHGELPNEGQQFVVATNSVFVLKF